MFARQSNILVISRGRVFGTEQIISAKQNQNIKEVLTGASSNLNIWRENREIVLKPKHAGNVYSQSSSKERCHGKFWQEHDLYCLCYGQRRNILIENLYDHNFPSKKYYRRPDIWNVVAELYSNGPYDRNSKFQCFEKVHLNFLYYSVLENNALQRTTSNGVRDCGRWIAYSRRKTHSVILHTFLLGVA